MIHEYQEVYWHEGISRAALRGGKGVCESEAQAMLPGLAFQEMVQALGGEGNSPY